MGWSTIWRSSQERRGCCGWIIRKGGGDDGRLVRTWSRADMNGILPHPPLSAKGSIKNNRRRDKLMMNHHHRRPLKCDGRQRDVEWIIHRGGPQNMLWRCSSCTFRPIVFNGRQSRRIMVYSYTADIYSGRVNKKKEEKKKKRDKAAESTRNNLCRCITRRRRPFWRCSFFRPLFIYLMCTDITFSLSFLIERYIAGRHLFAFLLLSAFAAAAPPRLDGPPARRST